MKVWVYHSRECAGQHRGLDRVSHVQSGGLTHPGGAWSHVKEF